MIRFLSALIVLAFLTVTASACDPTTVVKLVRIKQYQTATQVQYQTAPQVQLVQAPAPSPDIQDPTVVVPADNCPPQVHTQTIFRLQQTDPSYNYSYTRFNAGFRGVTLHQTHRFNGAFVPNNTIVLRQGSRFNLAPQPGININVNRGGFFNRGGVVVDRFGNVRIGR